MTANCFHPGFVASGFNRNNGALMAFGMILAPTLCAKPEKGADTLVWLANSADVSSETGGYFANRKRKQPSPAAQDRRARAGSGG